MTPCFLIVPTGNTVIEVSGSWGHCLKAKWGNRHHGREVVFRGHPDRAPKIELSDGLSFNAVCEYCGQPGGVQRATSIGRSQMWWRAETGEEKQRIAEFGPGAMWFADWYKRDPLSPDGRILYGWDWENQFTPPLLVATPGGDWNVDSRASNCTMKDDKLHRCWIRHGCPPNVTVDKQGHTCAAGAGSIQSGNYHGFLRNGVLT